jgi:vacuolar-type H+-ATPase subunit H
MVKTKLGKILGAALAMSAFLAVLPGCQKQEGPAEQAGKKVDQAVEQAGAKVDQAAKKAGEQIEKAGDSIQDAAKGDKK